MTTSKFFRTIGRVTGIVTLALTTAYCGGADDFAAEQVSLLEVMVDPATPADAPFDRAVLRVFDARGDRHLTQMEWMVDTAAFDVTVPVPPGSDYTIILETYQGDLRRHVARADGITVRLDMPDTIAVQLEPVNDVPANVRVGPGDVSPFNAALTPMTPEVVGALTQALGVPLVVDRAAVVGGPEEALTNDARLEAPVDFVAKPRPPPDPGR